LDVEDEVSGTEGGGFDTDWLGLGENCGTDGDVGVRLLIRSGIVDSGVRLRVYVFFLITVGTIAACECDTDIVGGDDALVGGMDFDRGASIENRGSRGLEAGVPYTLDFLISGLEK
jgi:hypothetical protein